MILTALILVALLSFVLGAVSTNGHPFYDSMFPSTAVIDGQPTAVYCKTVNGTQTCEFTKRSK